MVNNEKMNDSSSILFIDILIYSSIHSFPFYLFPLLHYIRLTERLDICICLKKSLNEN